MIPNVGHAQDAKNARTEYTVRATVDAPVSETTEAYRKAAQKARARIDVVYVSELEGDLAGTQARNQPVKTVPRERRSVDLGGFGVVLAVVLVLGGLLLWLKFGGGGMLLAREPRDDAPRKHATPAAWKLDEGAGKDANGLLTQIAAMSDRTAAMVLLLRHSLLAAARATDARFARSDTERLAFARLPKSWAHSARLETMLQQTELAHYGGRAVPEDQFSEALEAARGILTAASHKGQAHV